jgi:hypothetical protein
MASESNVGEIMNRIHVTLFHRAIVLVDCKNEHGRGGVQLHLKLLRSYVTNVVFSA